MPDLAVVTLDKERLIINSSQIIGKVNLKSGKVVDADAIVQFNKGWHSVPALCPVALPAALILFSLSIWGVLLWIRFEKEDIEHLIESKQIKKLHAHIVAQDNIYNFKVWKHPEFEKMLLKYELQESMATTAETRAVDAEERATVAEENFHRLEGQFIQLKRRLKKSRALEFDQGD